MENDWMYVKSNTLEKRLEADRKEGIFTDVTFVVGPEKNHEFKAHKLMLAAGNAEFENMLYGAEVSDDEIVIEDADPKGFENLIRYLYGAKIEIEDLSVARETYCVADKFKVYKLKLVAEKSMIKLVNCETTIEILHTAVELDMPRLKSRCIGIVSSQFDKVSASKRFLSNPVKAMELVLSLGNDPGMELVDPKLQENIVSMPSMIDSELMPDILEKCSKLLKAYEFRDVTKQLSTQECSSLKGSAFSTVLKAAADKVHLASPEITIAEDEISGIAVETSSCQEEVVDQDKKTESKDEVKNATDEEDSDDEEVIGDDVITDVVEHVDKYVKNHVSFVSQDIKASLVNAADDAMHRASKRLQKVVDDALFCLEEMSCLKT